MKNLIENPNEIDYEEFRKNPAFKNTSEQYIRLLYVSIQKAAMYVPKQEIPQSPNPLKLSKWFCKEISDYMAQIDAIEQECGVKCVCSKGCAHCCKQLIAISMSEFLAMQPILDNLPREKRLKLKEEAIKQNIILKENGIVTMCSTSNIDIYEYQKKYFDLQLKCPLLDENNSCLVYEVRPFNCSTYRNYGSPEDCKKDCSVHTVAKYDDWESVGLKRLYSARKPDRYIWILQDLLVRYL